MLTAKIPSRLFAAISIAVLVVGCGNGSKVRTARSQAAPTSFAGDLPEPGAATTSPPTDRFVEYPFLVSTSGAVLVAGGLTADHGPSSTVRMFDRASRSWRRLPSLPATTYVVGGASVADVPYLVGAECRDDREGSGVDELCAGATIFRLVDDAKRWQALKPPDGVFSSGNQLSEFGAVGDHSLAFMSNAAPYHGGLVMFDVRDDSWRNMALPKDSDGQLLVPCFTQGVLHLEATGPAFREYSSSDGPKPYAFDAWALQGSEWLGPEHVDLGVVVGLPSGDVGQLCTDGRFVTANGGQGMSLSVEGAQLRQTKSAMASMGKAPELGAPTRAGITADGAVLSVDDTGTPVQSAPRTVGTSLQYIFGAETDHSLDLLLSKPSNPDQVTILTVGRN